MNILMASTPSNWVEIITGLPKPLIANNLPINCVNVTFSDQEVRLYLDANVNIITMSAFKPTEGSKVGLSATYIAKE